MILSILLIVATPYVYSQLLTTVCVRVRVGECLQYVCVCIETVWSKETPPPGGVWTPPPGGFPIYYVPSSRTVCKRTPLEGFLSMKLFRAVCVRVRVSKCSLYACVCIETVVDNCLCTCERVFAVCMYMYTYFHIYRWKKFWAPFFESICECVCERECVCVCVCVNTYM